MKEFGKYILEFIEQFKVSEEKLLNLADSILPTETEKMATTHFGLHFKRLLARKQLSEGLLRNNLEKEFVRHWMYKNNFIAVGNEQGKRYADLILGKTASDDESIIVNTVIQWLGTNGGIDFINEVTKANINPPE